MLFTYEAEPRLAASAGELVDGIYTQVKARLKFFETLTTLERHGPVLQPHDRAGPIRPRRIGTQLERIGTDGRELVEELAGEIGSG